MNQSFGKAYKLCSKLLIDEIFSSGKMAKAYPFIIRYKTVELPTNTPFQVVISAPKRRFRHAFQRNRIKRVCREVLRKQKHILETPLREKGKQMGLFLIYTGKEELSSQELSHKCEVLFKKIIADI